MIVDDLVRLTLPRPTGRAGNLGTCILVALELRAYLIRNCWSLRDSPGEDPVNESANACSLRSDSLPGSRLERLELIFPLVSFKISGWVGVYLHIGKPCLYEGEICSAYRISSFWTVVREDEPALCVADASRVIFGDLEVLSAGDIKVFISEVSAIASAEGGRWC